jgi:hypothetical protein
MAIASGRWAWWNQYGALPLDACVRRAIDARLDGVIVKWGFADARSAFARAGVRWATERYVYPGQLELEAQRLADDIDRGAAFAVINAEIEWEGLAPEPMQRLVAEFRRLQPRAELYACVDTRGDRSTRWYQRVLAEHIVGWMPMVYPLAFEQPVARAFASALDVAALRQSRLPVLPVIQSYGGAGARMVGEQIDEVRRRGLPGYSAYTIAHASDDEWSVIVRDAPRGEEDEMADVQELRRLQAVAALFLEAAGYALRGAPLPDRLRAELRWLLLT